jgi:hypothetical protein
VGSAAIRDPLRAAEWTVVDHPFNIAWYPQLVGCKGNGAPPSYVIVRIDSERIPLHRRGFVVRSLR